MERCVRGREGAGAESGGWEGEVEGPAEVGGAGERPTEAECGRSGSRPLGVAGDACGRAGDTDTSFLWRALAQREPTSPAPPRGESGLAGGAGCRDGLGRRGLNTFTNCLLLGTDGMSSGVSGVSGVRLGGSGRRPGRRAPWSGFTTGPTCANKSATSSALALLDGSPGVAPAPRGEAGRARMGDTRRGEEALDASSACRNRRACTALRMRTTCCRCSSV